MTKKSRQKFLENEKNFWGEIKSVFLSFLKGFQLPKIVSDLTVRLWLTFLCCELAQKSFIYRSESLLKWDSNTGVFMWVLQNIEEQLFYGTLLVAAFGDVTLFTAIARANMVFFCWFLPFLIILFPEVVDESKRFKQFLLTILWLHNRCITTERKKHMLLFN